ncbi:ABC-F family ATP-binding cassette domain-containing protein [Actinoalloteichus fjordicus]|uniref:ATPase component of ABC transporters with duplicated ATPase domain n=1 Tax=Actinoalloteichus fjordicus TaxID=1612552 RepID=A0AAC9L7H7_9PSEU|nr:ABC-F family ATP-binding cassette domain-containing protein [Actinoalloteichus fjordicus]APU12798.1 ATPase component of ABC transporters with duplicated ATPase domain [Actinoalloteichus fjordicus]
MVNLVNLSEVSKSYGVRALLDSVSLGIGRGERVGVVGLNGGGKTTLLEVMAGIEPPDSGRVAHSSDLRMAVVTQRTELPEGSTVRQAILDPLGYAAEHEWASDARVRGILDGLGITARGLDTPVGTFSGGERRRVALAAALVQELDLIVLDEPTNHLDIEGVRWLADHLIARRCALIVVTHDRWFLDTVCTRTWEVVGGGVEQYEGGYADWIFARAERARQADAAEDRRRNLARKELAWLRRGAPARTSKPRYRIDAAETLISDVPPPRDTVELLTFAKRRLGRTVLELENVDLRAGDLTIAEDVTWRIGPGDRVGLVGVNGSGKTTLLRMLAGDREPASGRRIQGQTVRLAHLTQELHDLPAKLRVLEAVEEVATRVTLGKQDLSAAQLAERLGFPKGRQWTPVGDLSGGERRRLQLVRLLMAEPNVLLLDEPTNDLDIDTLQQLEDLLDSWPGTMVVVSHDRYLIERVCDKVVALFGDGVVTDLPGGIDEYLRRRERMLAQPKAAASAPAGSTSGGAAPTESEGAAPGAALSAADTRAARKQLAKLERRIATLDKKEATLNQALADAGSDTGRLMDLDAELREVKAEKSQIEEEWLLAADALEG